MNIFLTVFFTLVAAITLAWGFDRYRSRFIKTDLLIAVAFAISLLAFAYVRPMITWLKGVFALEKTYVLGSVGANAALLLLVLYTLGKVREIGDNVSDLTRQLSIERAHVDGHRADGGDGQVIKVVIPAYNEETTIRSVIDSLPEYIHGYQVIPVVVSDGSADDTATMAETDDSIVVEHPINQGQGDALKTGFEIAKRNDADIVVTMDADGQHPATELERLVEPIIDGSADFVMGSRHRGTDDSNNSAVRQSGIRFFTWLINLLSDADITDCTNGYRAIRGSDLKKLTLTEQRFSAPELIIEARKNGLRIQEIPITIQERQAGETKKPKLGYAIGLTRTILATWLR